MTQDNPLTTADVLYPVGIALAAHSLWGAYPVLSKLLLSRFDFPPLVFVASAQMMAMAAGLFLARRSLRWSLLWHPALILLALAAAGRGMTNIFAIKLTLSIYVQLITLLTPFVVGALGLLAFGETPPPHMFKAMGVAVVGATMALVGNPQTLTVRFGRDDVLGIGLTLLSVVALSLWQHMTRIITSKEGLQPTVALTSQAVGSVVVMGILSIVVGQDWGVWGRLPSDGWALFALIAVGIFMVGNIGQITALSRMKAAFYSSMLPWRLVITLGAGALLLGEQLESATQIVGVIVVIVTVSLYLRQRVMVIPATLG